MEKVQNQNKYKGISKKNGQIYVRFSYLSKKYPVKNFTKLYSCKTEKQAYEKLNEVKLMIAKGKDPFGTNCVTLNDYFYDRVEKNRKDGTWREHTCTQYTYFYESVINNTKERKQKEISIGWKKLNKITYDDLMLLVDSMSEKKGSYKSTLRRILNPLFVEGMKRKDIFENVITLLPVFKVEKKEKLKDRALDKNLNIVRKLYWGIQNYKTHEKVQIEQTEMFFTLLLFTGHRYGELLKLKKENVNMDEMIIKSPSEITKTNRVYTFPFPLEVVEYFDSVEKGLLFPNLNYGSMYGTFKRVIEKSDIQLFKDKRISMHDTRSFLLNIMREYCGVESNVADSCLEHEQSGVIGHYEDVSDKEKFDAFHKYWDLIRNGDIEKKVEVVVRKEIVTKVEEKSSSNVDYIKDLISMVKDGYITQEQFETERDKILN